MAVYIFSWPSLHERMCWTWGSNSGPLACQADTLPIELPCPPDLGLHCRPWSDCSWRSSLIRVCTVCQDLSVQKLGIIMVVNLTGVTVLGARFDRCYCPWCKIWQVLLSSVQYLTGLTVLGARFDRCYCPWCKIWQVLLSLVQDLTGVTVLGARFDRCYCPQCRIWQVLLSSVQDLTGVTVLGARFDRCYCPRCKIWQVLLSSVQDLTGVTVLGASSLVIAIVWVLSAVSCKVRKELR